MLQTEGFKSDILYHDYCKSERERVRGKERRVGKARTEEKPSGDQESTEQCFTIPFIPNYYL